MRNGKIIEENSPKYFIEKYQQNVLEDIFFNICSKNDSIEPNPINKELNTDKAILSLENKMNTNSNLVKFIKKELSSIRNRLSFSFGRLSANLYKDTIKCKRNTKLLLVQLLIPIIQITFFCLCIGRPPKNLPIGIVNYDNESSPDLGNIFESLLNSVGNIFESLLISRLSY